MTRNINTGAGGFNNAIISNPQTEYSGIICEKPFYTQLFAVQC